MTSLINIPALVAALMALSITPLNAPAAEANTAAAFQVMVFSKTLGYRHDSITNGIEAISNLGRKNGFAVDATEDSATLTTTNLARYRAIVFLSATGSVLNHDQEDALKNYITGGGGFAAIHGALFGPKACEDQWAWYGEMFCCAFTNHSSIQPAVVNIEDARHPSTVGLPDQWQHTDEWYNFTGTPRGCAHILATVDEATYHGGKMGADHPIAWCRPVGKGRMWYTALGHTKSNYNEPFFLQHILGGIRYAAAEPDH